jgi:hypothetical protein
MDLIMFCQYGCAMYIFVEKRLSFRKHRVSSEAFASSRATHPFKWLNAKDLTLTFSLIEAQRPSGTKKRKENATENSSRVERAGLYADSVLSLEILPLGLGQSLMISSEMFQLD